MIPPIDKITFAARYTDRRFLVPLERAEWEAVTAEAVSGITDAVISEAVHKLPPPMYAQAGERLERALRSRRDRLMEASREFYRLLARDVDVRATTGAEEFEIDCSGDGSVKVAIYARDAKSDGATPDPYFRRTFLPEETSEIRVYTVGGDDRVVEQGNGTDAILLRVISPPGTSELVDRSNQASAAKRYDTAPPPQISKEQLARALELDPQAERHARYEPFRDWGHDSLVFPQLSYDSTRGLLLGAYLQRTSYGFGLDPYESRMNLCDIPEPGASRVRSRFPHALAAERPPLRRVLGDRAGEVLRLRQRHHSQSGARLEQFLRRRTASVHRQPGCRACPDRGVASARRLRARVRLERAKEWAAGGPDSAGGSGRDGDRERAGRSRVRREQRNVPVAASLFGSPDGARSAGDLRQSLGVHEASRRDDGPVRLALAHQLPADRPRLGRAQLGSVSLLRSGLSRRHAVAVASRRDRSDEREPPPRLRPQQIRRGRRDRVEHRPGNRVGQVQRIPSLTLWRLGAVRRRPRVRRRRELVQVAHRGGWGPLVHAGRGVARPRSRGFAEAGGGPDGGWHLVPRALRFQLLTIVPAGGESHNPLEQDPAVSGD